MNDMTNNPTNATPDAIFGEVLELMRNVNLSSEAYDAIARRVYALQGALRQQSSREASELSSGQVALLNDLENAKARNEGLLAEIEGLKNVQEVASQGLESWRKRFDDMGAQVQGWFDEGVLEEGDEVSEWLFNKFDIETTEDVEVTVTAVWSGTVTVPKNRFVSDLEIRTTFPEEVLFTLDGERLDFSSVSFNDADID